jgi:hypothetical protein
MSSGGTSDKKNLGVIFGSIFLITAIGVGIVYATGNGLVALAVIFIGIIAWMFLIMSMLKKQLPTKTIVVTKKDGTTETVTTRVRTRSYLLCPECGKQFTASGMGVSESGWYQRDPERYATKLLRWHLINVHHHERLKAQREARTAPFLHEERPA